MILKVSSSFIIDFGSDRNFSRFLSELIFLFSDPGIRGCHAGAAGLLSGTLRQTAIFTSRTAIFPRKTVIFPSGTAISRRHGFKPAFRQCGSSTMNGTGEFLNHTGGLDKTGI
jgi:hypothetical protein